MKRMISFLLSLCAALAHAQDKTQSLYVPYEDLHAVVSADKQAVLMDRSEFEDLLRKAEAAKGRDDYRAAVIERSRYTAKVAAEQLTLAGELSIRTLTDAPIAVPLDFADVGLTKATLDGEPAPMNLNGQGRLVVVVQGKGVHTLRINGVAALQEMKGGGLRFAATLPEAVSGVVDMSLPGDQEIHANVPAQKRSYDAAADRTKVQLVIGGNSALSVIMLGNGRRDDDHAITLCDSATTVQLTESGQIIDAVFTTQVLRRGLRELQFALPNDLAVQKVVCPGMVKWSLDKKDGRRLLNIRFQSQQKGTKAILVQGSAMPIAVADGAVVSWTAPRFELLGADFQRGYLLVNPSRHLRVRSESIVAARRQDPAGCSRIPGLTAAFGRLYFHWGNDWRIQLQIGGVEASRHCNAKHLMTVNADGLQMLVQFQLTAIGREFFHIRTSLPPKESAWVLAPPRINGQTTGFEYRIVDEGAKRYLLIELASPVAVDRNCLLELNLQQRPDSWDWTAERERSRNVQFPVLDCEAGKINGLLAVSTSLEFDAECTIAGDDIERVSIGQMSGLGLGRDVVAAFLYEKAISGKLNAAVTRSQPRIYAGSTGRITISPQNLNAVFSVVYDITRARSAKLYTLIPRELGKRFSFTCQQRVRNRQIVADAPNLELPESRDGYDLWEFELEEPALGKVSATISFTLPHDEKTATIPLIRPVGSNDSQEIIAFQAVEELAVEIKAEGARVIDRSAAPELSSIFKRVLKVYQIETGAKPAFSVEITRHEGYGLPSGVAAYTNVRTVLGIDGQQQTYAEFGVKTSNQPTFDFRLPTLVKLLSATVNDQPLKPQLDTNGVYQLPLPPTRETSVVKLLIQVPPVTQGGYHRLFFPQPEGLPMNKVDWLVHTPEGYTISAEDTNMSFTQGTRKSVFRDMIPRAYLSGGSRTRDEWTNAEFVDGHVEAAKSEHKAEGPAGEAEPLAEQQVMDDMVVDAPSAQSPHQGAAEGTYYYHQPLAVKGRRTLPVTLVGQIDAGLSKRYSSIGTPVLAVKLQRKGIRHAWFGIGVFVAVLSWVLAIGLGAGRLRNGMLLATLLAVALVVLNWFCFDFAWGIVVGALVFAVLRLLQLIGRRIRARFAPAAAMLLFCALSFSLAAAEKDTLIVPYDGAAADANASKKVLVPYEKFVELWNLANPGDQMTKPEPGTELSISDVLYECGLNGESLRIRISAGLQARGKGHLLLPLPMKNIAVTAATFNGSAIQLQMAPNGMVLMLPPGEEGSFVLEAIATPELRGRKGEISLVFPALPAPVLAFRKPAGDLELHAQTRAFMRGKKGKALASRDIFVTEADGSWIVPLGMDRNLNLSWFPRTGSGAADKTLTANAEHDVHLFHWGLVGKSQFTFNFTSSNRDRFELVVPKSARLTALSGPNLRDFRITGERTIDGRSFQIVALRLYRSAEKSYTCTATWVDETVFGKPARLFLPRASSVGRESGKLQLANAGGVTFKVISVLGGRKTQRQKPGQSDLLADRTAMAESYYWPYRDFALQLQVDRIPHRKEVELNQLIRLLPEDASVNVQAFETAIDSHLFGSSYRLPVGYEVLEVVGEVIENWHVVDNDGARVLHINFNQAVESTEFAITLMRDEKPDGSTTLPLLTAIGAEGTVAAQSGSVAVQIAPTFDAETQMSRNLKSVAPVAMQPWIKDRKQLNQVRFAYTYDEVQPEARLLLKRKPTSIAAEVTAGLSVSSTQAHYTYRIRYRIDGSPVDHLEFRLAARYRSLVAVKQSAMRSLDQREDGDDTIWRVNLVREVTGVVDVALNFVLPVDGKTKELVIPEVRVGETSEYRAILAVQNLSGHELKLQQTGFRELGVSEQEEVFRSRLKNLQFAYHSFQTGWTAQLAVEPEKEVSRVPIIIDLMAITTVIDRAGNVRSQVVLSLDNRSEQFVELEIPASMVLWSALVAGQPVKPVARKGDKANRVLIPLLRTSADGSVYDVKLLLANKEQVTIKALRRVKPPMIRVVGVNVKRSTWSLRLPQEYRYLRPGGNMSPIAGQAEVRNINIESKVNQIKRALELASVGSSSGRTKKSMDYNYRMAEELEKEIEDQGAFIQSNVGEIGDDYQRLQKDWQTQNMQLKNLKQKIVQQQQELKKPQSTVNVLLNDDADNAGVSELTRNEPLKMEIGFLKGNRSRLGSRVNKQLRKSREKKPKVAPNAPKERLVGHSANDLLRDPRETKKQALETLSIELLGKREMQQLNRYSELQQQLRRVQTEAPNVLGGRSFRNFAQQQTVQGSDDLRKKLDSIIIRKISFEETPVSTVFEYLKNRSRALDPDGIGVNFLSILHPSSGQTTEQTAPALSIAEDPFAVEHDDLLAENPNVDDAPDAGGYREPTITMDFDNIPLGEAYRYVCEQAGLRYEVAEDGIVVLGPNVKRGNLELRFIPIDLRLFRDRGDDGSIDFRKFFEDKGITFPVMVSGDKASISYDHGTSKLIVRNTPKNLRLIERILSEVNSIPPQGQVAATLSDVDSVQLNVRSGVANYIVIDQTSQPQFQMKVLNSTGQTAAEVGAVYHLSHNTWTNDLIVDGVRSKNVYSMDLGLPDVDNTVQFDFSYPGGEPVLSLLAVPNPWFTRGKRALVLVVLAAVVWLIVRVVRRSRNSVA